jgi:mono/diheme cytochrome c family protein
VPIEGNRHAPREAARANDLRPIRRARRPTATENSRGRADKSTWRRTPRTLAVGAPVVELDRLVLPLRLPTLRNHENSAAIRGLPALVLAGAVALSLTVLGGCARSAPASQDARQVDGRELFARACAKCHSPEGSGGLPMASGGPKPIDLRDPEWQHSRSDEAIEAAIRDGRGAMPPFNDVLSPEEIGALARHVRSLGHR